MLDKIGLKYQTDKASHWHNYLVKYEKHFEKYKDEPIKLLEIGVSNGNSLKMWKEYFPKAQIYGIDINPICKDFEEDRIKIFIGDQSNQGFLINILQEIGMFEIIVDDGSHIMKDIIKSFEYLFINGLKDNGLYVIEDLHTCYLTKYNTDNSKNALDFLKERIGDLDFNGKAIDGDFCGDRQRQFDRIKSNFDITNYERFIESLTFYRSMCFIEKRKLDERNS